MAKFFLSVVALCLVFSTSALRAQTLTACYQKAQSLEETQVCLKKEFAEVKAEHNDVIERVSITVKREDKQRRTKVRWTALIRANKDFERYVTRECRLVELTTKGRRQAEKNAVLACKIGLYRVRTARLENRYLSAGKI